MSKAVQYKGFTIREGDRRYTLEIFTITKGKVSPTQQYFGGANTIAKAKEKIDGIVRNAQEKESAIGSKKLDFSKRYMVGHGTSIYETFDTAAELNAWWEARDSEGRYFCRLYDRDKDISILGCDYMWLKPDERWRD
jgi:hypothetical protein